MFVTLLPVAWSPLECEDLLARAPAACVRALDARSAHPLLEAIYWAAAGRAPSREEFAANELPSAWRVERIDALLEVIEQFGRELEERRRLGEEGFVVPGEYPRVIGGNQRSAWFDCAGWALLVVARRVPPGPADNEWVYALESAMDEAGDDLDELPPDVRARFAELTEGAFGFGLATPAG